MLIRFVVSNFLSFDKEMEFNMLASTSLKTHKHHVYDSGKVKVLKSSAIYGANGAGKSNLVKSIEFLRDMIRDGLVDKSGEGKKFKLNKVNQKKPSTFEIEFSIDKKIYAYGVCINNNIVIEEWLYESGITTEDKLIFERKQNESGKLTIRFAEKYLKTKKDKLLIELLENNLLMNNELLLGTTKVDLKIEEISAVRKWIENGIVIVHPGSKFQGLVPFLLDSSKGFKKFANDLLETFDTGVTEIEIQRIDFEKFFGKEPEKLKKDIVDSLDKEEIVMVPSDNGWVAVTKENNKYIVSKVILIHKDIIGNKVIFDIPDESDGTQRLLDFIPAFYGILEDDITFIIDEIDQSLHPTLLLSLVRKIMNDETIKGQLVFTTHESNLLDMDIFRQDEIWFAEKDKKSSATQLYSLSEFNPRYDLDIRKGYLKGRFGAIPFLARLEDLNWEKYGA